MKNLTQAECKFLANLLRKRQVDLSSTSRQRKYFPGDLGEDYFTQQREQIAAIINKLEG